MDAVSDFKPMLKLGHKMTSNTRRSVSPAGIGMNVVFFSMSAFGATEMTAVPPTTSELSTVAVAALGQLESTYRQFHGLGVFTAKNLISGTERVHDVEFALDRDSELLVETVRQYTGPFPENTRGVTLAKVATPRWSFRLQRSRGQLEYRTDFMSAADPAAAAVTKESMRGSIQLLSSPWMFMGWIPLSKVLAHPTFVADAISEDQDEREKSICIQFRVQPSSDKWDPLYTWRESDPISGWVVLCPQRHWAIKAYEIQVRESDGTTLKHIGENTYDGDHAGSPVLSRAENRFKSGNREIAKATLEIKSLEFGSSPPDRFTPSAFGLTADVPLAPPVARFLPLLLIVIAVLLTAAVSFRYAARRKVTA